MQVYTRLSERMGLSDHLMVLNFTVSKIATNLKCFAECEEVVEMTLNLFQDLASGYMSGKLLLKLDAINFILVHHTHEHFPFLDPPSNTRNRTIFYATLGRLLFMEDTPAKFAAFMSPMSIVCAALSQQATDLAAFRTPQVTTAVVMYMLRLASARFAHLSLNSAGCGEIKR
jgi:exportin-7